MAAPDWWHWVALIAGWVIVVGGLVLLVFALFVDRPRGRRRCPKCWYGMDGVPAVRTEDAREVFICPECGRELRGVKRLLRTRRRRGWAVLAAFMLLGGYATLKVPAIVANGWTAVVPDTVLMVIAPASPFNGGSFSGPVASPLLGRGAGPSAPAGGGVWPQSWDELRDKLLSDLHSAAWERLGAGSMWRWQSQWYLQRDLDGWRARPDDWVVLPGRWLVGERIPVFMRSGAAVSGWRGMTVRVRSRGEKWVEGVPPRVAGRPAPCTADDFEIGLEIGGKVAYRTRLKKSVVITGDRSSVLRARADADANERVLSALQPRLCYDADRVLQVMIDDRSSNQSWRAIDFGVYARVEVSLRGQVLGTGRVGTSWNMEVWKNWEEAAMVWKPHGAERAVSDPEVVITLRGDLELACDEYVEWPFDKPGATAWSGTITVPARIEQHPGVPQDLPPRPPDPHDPHEPFPEEGLK